MFSNVAINEDYYYYYYIITFVLPNVDDTAKVHNKDIKFKLSEPLICRGKQTFSSAIIYLQKNM